MVGQDEGQKLRVLVVENHDEVRDLMASLVRAQGWIAVPVAGVREALDQLTTQTIDAIVSDWELDDGDGRSVIASATRMYGHRIPAVMVSSYASDHLREEARAAGAIDLLQKPFRIDRLMDLLAQAVQLHESVTA